MLKHREVAVETVNRFTNRMPKLTPEMARKVRRVTGKDLQPEISVTPDSIPDDMARQLNGLKQENAELRGSIKELMDKLNAVMNHLTPNAPAQVTELTAGQVPPVPSDPNYDEAHNKVTETFSKPSARRGPRREPATLPDSEK